MNLPLPLLPLPLLSLSFLLFSLLPLFMQSPLPFLLKHLCLFSLSSSPFLLFSSHPIRPLLEQPIFSSLFPPQVFFLHSNHFFMFFLPLFSLPGPTLLSSVLNLWHPSLLLLHPPLLTLILPSSLPGKSLMLMVDGVSGTSLPLPLFPAPT